MIEKTILPIGCFVDKNEISLQTGPFGTQLKASDYVASGIPVINVRNIGMGSIIEGNLEFISEETRDRLASHVLSYQDIVFGRKGAVERHAFISKKCDGWFQGSDCIRMRINSGRLLPRFVSYSFLTPLHQTWMQNHCSHGATMASLNQDIIKLIPIAVYDIQTQEKIIAILSLYDDLIENNNRRIAILEELTQRLYREWFVKLRFPGHVLTKMVKSELGMMPKSWSITQIANCCVALRRGISPIYNDVAEGIVINQKCIRTFSVDLKLARRQCKAFASELQVQQGDILINSTGVGTLGRVAQIYHSVQNCTVDSHITLMRPFKDIKYYIGSYFRHKQEELMDMGTGSTGQTELCRNVIGRMKIIVPDAEVLTNYENILSKWMTLKARLQEKNNALCKIRDMLLPRLISGDIDISCIDIPVLEALDE